MISHTVVIGLQGIFNWGNEVQPQADFILGTRKSFPKQLETKRRIQESGKQVSKLHMAVASEKKSPCQNLSTPKNLPENL